MRPRVEDGVGASLVRDLVLGRRVGERHLRVGEDVLATRGPSRLDVEDEELDQVRRGGEGGEGVAPVDGGGEVDGLEGGGVNELKGVGDTGADGEGAKEERDGQYQSKRLIDRDAVCSLDV